MEGSIVNWKSALKRTFDQYVKDNVVSFYGGNSRANLMGIGAYKFWKEFDTDTKGAIRSGELDRLRQSVEQAPGRVTAIEAYDTAMQDGKITKSDGDAIAKAMGMEPDEFWVIYDPNNNGVISGDEAKKYKQALEALGEGGDSSKSFNTFRGIMEILNSWSCRYLADYLESVDGKGTVGNNRFGTLGLYRISQLSLNDPKWEQAREPILPQCRQLVKDMATQALDTKYKDLMNQVHNGDGIFESGDMEKWLRNNVRKGALGKEGDRFHRFRDAMVSLNKPEGRAMMDFLESSDGKGTDVNERFGLLGMYRLSKLRSDSPQWSAKSVNDQTLRKELIKAAVTALERVNERYLFMVHNGDGIFEKDDMSSWLDLYPRDVRGIPV